MCSQLLNFSRLRSRVAGTLRASMSGVTTRLDRLLPRVKPFWSTFSLDDLQEELQSSPTVQPDHPEYLSIADLARRWRCSRGTVYNRLRSAGAKVLTFAPCGKRSKKGVSIDVVQQIETRNTRRLC